MFTVFLFAAVLGGIVFIVQFLLALVGMGGDEFDIADDFPDQVDISDDLFGAGEAIDQGSTSLFGVISFRTVVAAVMFFGLIGIASLEAGLTTFLAWIVALGGGFLAMFAVHWLMKQLYELRQNGSIRIQRSVGRSGTVYIPIPPQRSGTGKIQLRMQGRIMEYAAVTAEQEKLSTGAKVVVVNVLTPTTLEVELIRDSVSTA